MLANSLFRPCRETGGKGLSGKSCRGKTRKGRGTAAMGEMGKS